MDLTSSFSASLNGPDWLKTIRARVADNIERLALPSTTEELWRYSRVDEIDLENFSSSSASSSPESHGIPRAATELLASLGDLAAAVITIDGAVSHKTLGPSAGRLQIRQAADFDDPQVIETDRDAFVRLNTAFAPDPIFIDVPDGVAVEKPIVLVHCIDGEDAAVFPRVVVRIGESAQATVVEYFMSSPTNALVSSVTELAVAQAAHLTYVAAQALASSVRHIGLQRSSVERDATLNSSTIAVGGDYARIRTDSRLVGAGASSKLRAVFVGNEHQMHDFRTLQDHRAPKTTSDLLFKGVVGDSARSVYSGLIRVEKGASGTNAYQTNRNLVLSEGAHADSVPNLEIEENDVKCSHASAVGPVDEEQLYYLESRGVPTDIAERLIVSGFLDEIIQEIPVAEIRDVLNTLVRTKLNSLVGSVVR